MYKSGSTVKSQMMSALINKPDAIAKVRISGGQVILQDIQGHRQ